MIVLWMSAVCTPDFLSAVFFFCFRPFPEVLWPLTSLICFSSSWTSLISLHTPELFFFFFFCPDTSKRLWIEWTSRTFSSADVGVWIHQPHTNKPGVWQWWFLLCEDSAPTLLKEVSYSFESPFTSTAVTKRSVEFCLREEQDWSPTSSIHYIYIWIYI